MSWLRSSGERMVFPFLHRENEKALWSHSHHKFQTGFSLGALTSGVTTAAQPPHRDKSQALCRSLWMWSSGFLPQVLQLHGGSTEGSRHLTKLRCFQQLLDSDSHCQDKALLGAVHGICQALIQLFHKPLQPFPEWL